MDLRNFTFAENLLFHFVTLLFKLNSKKSAFLYNKSPVTSKISLRQQKTFSLIYSCTDTRSAIIFQRSLHFFNL